MRAQNQIKAARYVVLRDRLLEASAAEAWAGAQEPAEAQALEAELTAARLELDRFVTGLITGVEV